MKCKNLKRVLSLLVVSVMSLSVYGCGAEQKVSIEPMEIEEVNVLGFDFLGGEDVMPISGFYGPTLSNYSYNGQSLPDYFTDDIFALISECGVNMIGHSYTNYELAPSYVYKMLELGENHNLGVFVYDPMFWSLDPDNLPSVEEMAEQLTQYCDYPAFCGVYVADEPGTPYFKPTDGQVRDVATLAPIFQGLRDLEVVGYGNMHPVWDEMDYEKYNQMLDEYCSTCNPYYLSFDSYVWDQGRTKEGYFYNMDVIRECADKYNIPFWCYIQAGGQFNDAKNYFDSAELYPTEGQMNWNVSTALAYGVKGIQYFPIMQPIHFAYADSTDFDFQRNGLIGAWGNKTQWWHYAKNINQHISVVDNVLMNSVNKGIIASGEKAKEDLKDTKALMQGTSWRELKSVQGNALIGCFNYQGKTALYVVNYEETYAQEIILNLQETYNISVTQNTDISNINTQKLVLDLQPGEGALIVFD